MISEKHNFAFIHINRTGGSSIEKALKPYGKKYPKLKNVAFAHTQHINYAELNQYLGSDIATYFTFTFVRNPGDRVVSYYHSGAIRKNMSFTEFVIDRYKNKNYVDYPRMYQSCCSGLGVDGLRNIDYIGHFETLKEDFKNITENFLEFGTIKLPHEKKSKYRVERNYKKYYNDTTEEIIRNTFSDDISHFCYVF